MAARKPLTVAPSSVLVVDDHPFFRAGLVQWLKVQSGLVCCGEADSIASARQAVSERKPDLVILDLRLGQEDGIELIKQFTIDLPDLRILVMSQGDEAIYAERVLRAGAFGYVMKAHATIEVLNAIRVVLAGEIYVSQRIAVRMLKSFLRGNATEPPGELSKLSDRELSVFQLIGSGLGTSKIAEHLHLSVKTVESYRENIKHKLGLADATTLVRAAAVWAQNQTGPTAPKHV
jgi:DNA-binding NarL/FixJ family response regulator